MIIPQGSEAFFSGREESHDWFDGFERGWNERQEDWEKLQKKIIDLVCHSSDSVIKQARANVPEKDIKEWFVRELKEL